MDNSVRNNENQATEKAGKDESIVPYEIIKLRSAVFADENTDIEAAKDKIAKLLAEQIKPYIVFDVDCAHPPNEEELYYPILKGTLFVVKLEN